MLPSDPLRDRILPLMEQYPLQAGPLYTAYKDLALAVEWRDLRIVPLVEPEWITIIGHKRTEDALRVVLPLPLHTTSLLPSSLKSIFTAIKSLSLNNIPKADEAIVPSVAELKARAGIRPDDPSDPATSQGEAALEGGNAQEAIVSVDADGQAKVDIDRDTLYMAICTTDSTVVYYKLSRGVKKPADIPDE